MGMQFDIPSIVNDENADYYKHLKAREFRLQKCSSCGYIRTPARRECPECLSEEYSWERMSGNATVQTYTWYFKDVLDPRYTNQWSWREPPYNVAVVKLDEGPNLITNIERTTFEELRVGLRVIPVFVDISPEYAILRFALQT
jgi:uncharacterized OB-fold protein